MKEDQHVHFEIKTEAGNSATILGNPNMGEETRKALAAMIDAVAKMANATTPLEKKEGE